MKIKDAVQITGGLSRPSKMPGCSYSLPATACKTGARLRKKEGTVCSRCYGCKGRYSFPHVQEAQKRRLGSIDDPQWVKAMVVLIENTGSDVFRFHDSGDIQSLAHLKKIITIARRLPHIKFWIPTKETKLVRLAKIKGARIPSNLIIRHSSHYIGEHPLSKKVNTSTVESGIGWRCPVKNGTETCDTYRCRACWDKNVHNVDYHYH